jgi:hypothetical protein
MNAARRAERIINVNRALDYLKQNELSVADLVALGGEDLRGTRKQRQRARLVERAWELMARLGVTHAMIDPSSEGEYRIARHRTSRAPAVQEVAFENKRVSCPECGKVSALYENSYGNFCSLECSVEYRKKQCAALVEYHNCSLAA